MQTMYIKYIKIFFTTKADLRPYNPPPPRINVSPSPSPLLLSIFFPGAI